MAKCRYPPGGAPGVLKSTFPPAGSRRSPSPRPKTTARPRPPRPARGTTARASTAMAGRRGTTGGFAVGRPPKGGFSARNSPGLAGWVWLSIARVSSFFFWRFPLRVKNSDLRGRGSGFGARFFYVGFPPSDLSDRSDLSDAYTPSSRLAWRLVFPISGPHLPISKPPAHLARIAARLPLLNQGSSPEGQVAPPSTAAQPDNPFPVCRR